LQCELGIALDCIAIFSTTARGCDVYYRLSQVILKNIGCRSKWLIWVSPDATFQGDSESSGSQWIPFLIRQENTKYSQKVDDKN
jgi:hypothetical protein